MRLICGLRSNGRSPPGEAAGARTEAADRRYDDSHREGDEGERPLPHLAHSRRKDGREVRSYSRPLRIWDKAVFGREIIGRIRAVPNAGESGALYIPCHAAARWIKTQSARLLSVTELGGLQTFANSSTNA